MCQPRAAHNAKGEFIGWSVRTPQRAEPKQIYPLYELAEQAVVQAATGTAQDNGGEDLPLAKPVGWH